MPDLTTLGKVIGGGLPVGAYGGRAAIMDQISPLGPVYQAGTLSGNPVAMAAGLAMLKALGERPQDDLSRASTRLPPSWSPASPQAAQRRRSRGHRQPGRQHVHLVLYRSRRSSTGRPPRPATPNCSAASIAACSTPASGFPVAV